MDSTSDGFEISRRIIPRPATAAQALAVSAQRMARPATREQNVNEFGRLFLGDVRQQFAAQRTLAERAIAQLDETQLFRSAGGDGNSVAILMQHVGGNLRSRWTDPLRADGEKPDRNRDGEFEIAEGTTPSAVRDRWDRGWQVLDDALVSFTADDLVRTITIRRQPLLLLQAINRSLTHTAQHVGQIVLLARQWKGSDWETLSIPRGRSADFT